MCVRVTHIPNLPSHTSYSMILHMDHMTTLLTCVCVCVCVCVCLAGYQNILEWSVDKERTEGIPQDESAPSDIFKRRDSARFEASKTRPLYVKLEMLLDLMFRWVRVCVCVCVCACMCVSYIP